MTMTVSEETMDDQFDAQALMVRARLVAQEIRRSDVYPALIGGMAGGIAGALMAALIAGRVAARRAEDTPREKESRKFNWSVREMVQLATVVASLAKQVQAWYKGQGKR
jgi:gas vesicle protein